MTHCWSGEAERMFLRHAESSPLGRSRTPGGSLRYFTMDDMGLGLLKLYWDDTYLFAFRQHLPQHGVCQPSLLPEYLFS